MQNMLDVGGSGIRNPDQVTGQGAPRTAELGLSVRSHSRLLRSGIETIEHLAAMTDDDLMAIGGLGVKSVADIREKLTGGEAWLCIRRRLCFRRPEPFSAARRRRLIGRFGK